MATHNLVVLIGATGVGKTDVSILLAKYLHAPIVSSDSRQIYIETTIGTAKPNAEQMAAVPHYFISERSITEDYTAGRYEKDALERLSDLWQVSDNVILSGGSGMYIDALCNGMDDIPESDGRLRQELTERLENNGLEELLTELKTLDPEFYHAVDQANPRRVLRALEVCLESGMPYSVFRLGQQKKRDFRVIKIGLERDRAELYDRINRRVDIMLADGLEEEARKLYPHKHLNALQTVGYRELFDYFDGKISRPEAIELIKRNSRRYAKRQMTWFRRDSDIRWFAADDFDGICEYLDKTL